ncbi:MAG TPA: PVC-type heme-binding CxxCH protein [Pirellulales bacterium]|nr:PVC-type heme-binding CxxCH protein [Pirellulales bacterium]
MLCLLAFSGASGFAGHAFAEKKPASKPPSDDPEQERQAFQVADGFEVNLWAADPLIQKPIEINFDPQGRLWVASSETYPQVRPGKEANDKILVLEDTKHAGHADKTTVFASGLLIPTGVLPGDGGVYAANSTELLFFSDTKGTGHADTRRVVLSGFGTEDTHHILHTLRWGPDGMMYCNQSVYIHSHIETPYGPRLLNGSGIWQFRPETMELNVFARGWWNPWGHSFDRWGNSFVTDGAGGQGINYCVPGGWYETAVGARRTLPGLNPGSPKECSLEIISGRQFPDDWQGNLITNDFRAHRVCRYVISENGSSYTSKELPELIKTNFPAFRPVDVKLGPDGALYIADWYNPIINHGEVDFRDPRRDHTHGRIWRVTAKGRPLVDPPQLVGASDVAVLDALKAPEDFTRQQARRVLKERGARVLPALAAWVKELNSSTPGAHAAAASTAASELDHQRLEALWVYQALRHVEPDLLRTLLHSTDYHARAAATRVLAAWHADIPDVLALLAERVVDGNPHVRLEAVRACAAVPTAAAAEIAMRALDRPLDRFLDYAVWQTANDLQDAWLPAVKSGEDVFAGNASHLTYALQAVGSRDVVPLLMGLLREGKLPPQRTEGALQLVAVLGGTKDLGTIFAMVLSDATPIERRRVLLQGLLTAAEQRGSVPSGDLNRLAKLIVASGATGDESLQTLAIRAAGLWKVETMHPKLAELALASSTSESSRAAAIESLAAMGGSRSREVLESLTAADRPFAIRSAAVVALAQIDLAAAASRAAKMLAAAPAAADPAPLIAGFLQRKAGPAALAAAIASEKLSPDIAKLSVRAVRASASEQPALVAALTTAGGLTIGGKRMPRGAELERLVAEVRAKGDPARGEAIFRRQDESCSKCHSIGGVGGQVAPDLSSIGASAPVDYLIESVLEPSAKIKDGFETTIVTTDSGRVFTGIKNRQTDKDLVLRDANDHEISIPLSSIDTAERSRTSLMPVGLADGLTRAELVDLVRFLSELGKVGPYSLSKAPIARRWQSLIQPPHAEPAKALASAVVDDALLQWTPAYSRVAGDLPLDDLPQLAGERHEKISIVRCRVDVAAAGKVDFRLNSAAGLALRVDGKPIPAAPAFAADLTAGQHTIVVQIDRHERTEPLRLAITDRAGSSSRAVFVGGR